ncbi:PREDICTED: B-cell receptor-associated protein 31 isoform X1 [Colobus angolensis palliatus]|uniref:B-cell receptor-associated protein 31 isoform X1 n=1 Tax=Colobus angolensis palliatus TaxID=336983 RepID=UPI0005F38F62|nr:PREDICTED: B-cell receptor-associated protein 31 isoform X1 [Colobus angolensis palliatus]
MSLQWTAVATFLYAEVFVVLLLCIPFISPKRWQKIFKSRLVELVVSYGNTFFVVLIVILVLLVIDAVREIRKYDDVTEKVNLQNNPGAMEHFHMKLFRAQRNLYIAGFSLLLSFLLRRLVTLISQQATLLASNEAFKKQAESASEAAKKYMEENDQLKKGAAVDGGKLDVGNAEVKLEEENRSLKADLQKLNDELASTKQSEARPCLLTRREVQRSLLCPLLPILCQTISNKPCTHARGLPENKQIAPCFSNPNAVMLSPQASEAKWFEWGSGGTRLQLVGLDCSMLEQCTLGFSCPQCGMVAPACLGAENEGSV